jgi:hypothetical protein
MLANFVFEGSSIAAKVGSAGVLHIFTLQVLHILQCYYGPTLFHLQQRAIFDSSMIEKLFLLHMDNFCTWFELN